MKRNVKLLLTNLKNHEESEFGISLKKSCMALYVYIGCIIKLFNANSYSYVEEL